MPKHIKLLTILSLIALISGSFAMMTSEDSDESDATTYEALPSSVINSKSCNQTSPSFEGIDSIESVRIGVYSGLITYWNFEYVSEEVFRHFDYIEYTLNSISVTFSNTDITWNSTYGIWWYFSDASDSGTISTGTLTLVFEETSVDVPITVETMVDYTLLSNNNIYLRGYDNNSYLPISYYSGTLSVRVLPTSYYASYPVNITSAPSWYTGSTTFTESSSSVSYTVATPTTDTIYSFVYSTGAGTGQVAGSHTFNLIFFTPTVPAVLMGAISYTHTITHIDNDGSGGSTTRSVEDSSQSTLMTIVSYILTREGYTFLGWSESSTDTAATYSPGESIMVGTDTIVLYGVWAVNMTGTPNDAATVGSSYSYNPTITATGCTISVSGASWLTVSGNSIIGTPTTAGTYDITLTVSKTGFAPSTQTFTITVVSVLSFESSPSGGAIAYAV